MGGDKISLLGGRHRSARFQPTDAKEGNCERVCVKSGTMRFSILCRRRHYQGIARPLALRSTPYDSALHARNQLQHGSWVLQLTQSTKVDAH